MEPPTIAVKCPEGYMKTHFLCTCDLILNTVHFIFHHYRENGDFDEILNVAISEITHWKKLELQKLLDKKIKFVDLDICTLIAFTLSIVRGEPNPMQKAEDIEIKINDLGEKRNKFSHPPVSVNEVMEGNIQDLTAEKYKEMGKKIYEACKWLVNEVGRIKQLSQEKIDARLKVLEENFEKMYPSEETRNAKVQASFNDLKCQLVDICAEENVSHEPMCSQLELANQSFLKALSKTEERARSETLETQNLVESMDLLKLRDYLFGVDNVQDEQMYDDGNAIVQTR